MAKDDKQLPFVCVRQLVSIKKQKKIENKQTTLINSHDNYHQYDFLHGS